MGLKRFLLFMLAGVVLHTFAPGMSVAQQVTPETLKRISNGVEAYYKEHPEMRPEALRAATSAAAEKARADGYCARPVYPKEALRAELQGRVDLEFLIDIDGTVADSRIIKSTGFPVLDNAAIAGLSKCQFKPQLKDGTPAPAWLGVSYVFSLE